MPSLLTEDIGKEVLFDHYRAGSVIFVSLGLKTGKLRKNYGGDAFRRLFSLLGAMWGEGLLRGTEQRGYLLGAKKRI